VKTLVSPQPARPRILCLGFDAADKDLIAGWAREGDLPAFRTMTETSACGPMTTPPGQYAGSVWPSFFTSVTPARHGRYFFTQLNPGTYDYAPFLPKDLKRAPFWTALSESGVRTSIIDVPKAPEATSFNGVQVLDWGTHDPETDHIRCFPAGFGKEITSRYGPEPVGPCDRASRDAAGLKHLCDNLCKRAEVKTRIIKDMITETDSDLTIAVFSESHCAGHQLWHLHDPSDPKHDPELASRIGNPLKNIYSAIDSAVGDILRGVDEDTIVVMFTSHGIGPHNDGTFLLKEILSRLQTAPPTSRQELLKILKHIWGMMPTRLKSRVRRRARNLIQKTESVSARDQDFFAVLTNDNCGGIRVNLKGREPNGRVDPGSAYERLLTELTQDLREIVNDETQTPVVQEVLRTDQLFEGACLDDLPDLNVLWDQRFPIRKITSPKIGKIEKEYVGHRTGDHRDQGFLWVKGPGIVPGPLPRVPSIMDIGPTLAELLGVRLPDVDGIPINLLQPA